MRLSRLGDRRGDAVIADLGIGQDDNLTGIARVGDDRLVAGHRRVEDDFAERLALGAGRISRKDRSVFERQ